MSQMKCAVIGAGWWSTFAHIPALQNHPDAEVIAITKRTREAAEKVAADFNIPNPCITIEEVLALKPDAVVIGTTPNVHFEQAKSLLEQGIHVLIEKPMTLHLEEARELIEIARSKHLQFLISCPWHYTRHSLQARKRILDGELGEIRLISILMTNFVEDFIRGTSTTDTHSGEGSYLEPNKASYSDPTVAGGGQVYTQVSHVAAYLKYLTQQDPTNVYAQFDNAGAAVDLFDAMTIKMDKGTLVSLASAGAPMQTERQYEVRIFGDKGMIFLELWKGTISIHNRQNEVVHLDNLTEEEIYPHEAPAINLIDAITGKADNLSPATFGLSAMEIIDAACRSAESGEAIFIR